MSLAIVNGKYYDHQLRVCETRNILIQGGIIAGVGYIPDEDEASIQVFDAKKAMMVPMVTDFIFASSVEAAQITIQTVQTYGVQQVIVLPSESGCMFHTPSILTDWLGNVSVADQSLVQIAAPMVYNNSRLDQPVVQDLLDAGASYLFLNPSEVTLAHLEDIFCMVEALATPLIIGSLAGLSNHYQINQGAVSFQIGVKGVSITEEDAMVQHMLSIMQSNVSQPVHFQCVTSAQSVRAIHAYSQACKHPMTIGVSPFHGVLHDTHLLTYNPQIKFNPPLRSPEQSQQLLQVIQDGMVSHFTALHTPVVGDAYPKPFTQMPLGVPTIQWHCALAAHVLSISDVPLESMASYLQVPHTLAGKQSRSSGLQLGQPAHFSLIHRHTDCHDQSILGVDGRALCGGFLGGVKHGILTKYNASNALS